MAEAENEFVTTPYLSFYELEKEMDMFSLKYKDIAYWQFVRVIFLNEISMKRFSISCQNSRRKFEQEILGAFKAMWKMNFAMWMCKTADIIQLRQYVTTDNKGHEQKNLRFDYLNLDNQTVMDLYAVGNYWHFPKFIKYSAAPAEWKVILWKIKRKLFGEEEIDQEQQSILKSFFKKINQIYGMDFQYSYVLKNIQFEANSFGIYKKFYKILFQKISAKLLMLEQHYGYIPFPAIAAAKELGMKVIELQHGAINQHKSFWYEEQSSNGKILPDYFFVYGQWWKDQIKMPTCVQILPLGSPYVEQQIRDYPLNKQRNQKSITFFSNVLSGNVLVDLIKKHYKLLTDLQYKIVFKLHPDEVVGGWKEAYPFLAEHPEIEVVERASVYKLFSATDIVIGIISTVFFEALAYDHLKIALLRQVGCTEMDSLIHNGYAVAIESDEDFVKLLQNEDARKDTKVIERTSYWKENAHQNTVDFIMKLLEE